MPEPSRPRPLLLLMMILLSAAALAELPPLSPSMLQSEAKAIVIGHVVQRSSAITKVELGTNRVYTIQIAVDSVEKGDVKAGDVVSVTYWQTNSRPHGWVGPGGQYQSPPDGKIRFYLGQSGRDYYLLSPNGWAAIKP